MVANRRGWEGGWKSRVVGKFFWGGGFSKTLKGDEKCILLNSFKHGFKNYKYILFVVFLISSFSYHYEMFTIYCGYFPVYSEWSLKICSCSKLMRRDTITVQEFLLECFLYEGYVQTWECPGWKKTENLISVEGWSKNVLGGKISKN